MRVVNHLIPSSTKRKQNVLGCKRVILSWKLHILTAFRICPSKIWACHGDEVSQTADNAVVTPMKIWDRVFAMISFNHVNGSVEVRVWLHWGEARSCIPEIVCA